MAVSMNPIVTGGNMPTLQQDLIGSAINNYPTRTRGFVFGRAPAVQNTAVDIWEGPTATYVFPPAAVQMTVVSTNAADAAAGTGVRQIMIHYLDVNYAIRTEYVTLNGITPVNTVATNIFRINSVHATAVGSGGVSVGNISITNGGVTYSYITAGSNTSRQAVYTVPAGVKGYISHWQTSSGSAGSHFCRSTIRATTHDDTLWPGVFLVQDEQGTQNGGIAITFPTPIPIPATTDIKMSAISDNPAANVVALAAIMGWFEAI